MRTDGPGMDGAPTNPSRPAEFPTVHVHVHVRSQPFPQRDGVLQIWWCAGALLLGSEDTRRDSVTDLPDVRPRVVSTRPVALW